MSSSASSSFAVGPMGQPLGDPTLLHPQVARGLTDKLYEKRKAAALEIEKFVFCSYRHVKGYKVYWCDLTRNAVCSPCTRFKEWFASVLLLAISPGYLPF
jgi:hypothetical protein